MRAFDLSPLFSTTVGFDRMARMLEQMPSENAPTYPPYNIQKMGENAYRVTLAVAGFGEDEIGDRGEGERAHRRRARSPRRTAQTRAISTAASPPARSSGASTSPITSR